MSSSAAKKSNPDRYVTRRIRDKEGNIVVKRYKRSSSGLSIEIPWLRLPSVFLGVLFGGYAYLINLYRNESLGNVFNEAWTTFLQSYFDSFTGIFALLVTGAFAVGMGTILAWALTTKGFKIKKWPAATRQLLTIVVITLLFSAVFSSFLNESGIVRHQDEAINVDDDYDLSNLDSPFYSELLNGLLDLIGNIPDPQEIIGTVEPGDGEPAFDPNEDTYLWRFKVEETYNTENKPHDYSASYSSYTFDSPEINTAEFGTDYKTFQMSSQYLTMGSGYSGDILAPWNSIHYSPVDVSQATMDAVNNSEISLSKATSYQTINNQASIDADFSDPSSSGYLNYEAYWVPEDKEGIASGAVLYEDFANAVASESIDNQLSSDFFTEMADAGKLNEIYGAASLPEYYGSDQIVGVSPDAFQAQLESIRTDAIDNGNTVYEVVLKVTNLVQAAILDIMQNDPEAFQLTEGTATANDAPEGTDKAYYFWNQVANDEAFGLKDAIAGLVNMLRELNIPTRPVLGFAIGDISSEEIVIRAEHIHFWIDSLIPWDDAGQTQYSWGAFNPMPAFKYYSEQGQVEYGKNSLGTQPDVEMAASNGEETEIPDAAEGETSSFTLADFGLALNLGTRVLYDDSPTAGQKLNLKFLTEAELSQLEGSSTAPSGGVGTDLGSVTTQSNTGNWGNFSIIANDNGSLTTTIGGESNVISDLNINPVNPFGANGEKNIYAIVAMFGLSFDFVVVGWSLDASVSLDVSDVETVEVTDPGVFAEDTFAATYTYLGEQLTYDVEVTRGADDPNGDPIEGQNVTLLFLSPDELNGLESDIEQNLVDPVADFGIGVSGTTDSSGQVSMNYTISESTRAINLAATRYYSMVAYLPGTGAAIYDDFIVHISGDFELGYEITFDEDNRYVNVSEEVVWPVNVTSIIKDSTLNAASSSTIEGRAATDLDLTYHIMNKTAYDNNIGNNANIIALLDGCTTNLDAKAVPCYQLTLANGQDPNVNFGILSISTSATGFITELIFTGGTVPLTSYYLFVYAASEQLFTVNSSQRFAFAPYPLSGSSADNIDQDWSFNYQFDQLGNDEVVQSEVSEDENVGFLPMVLISAITISVVFVRLPNIRRELL